MGNESAVMKEYPILFSDPMVRAIIAGEKTQTRRIVKPQPTDAMWEDAFDRLGTHHATPVVQMVGSTGGIGVMRHDDQFHATAYLIPNIRCPYGQPGDRLWVREAWAKTHVLGMPAPITVYRAYDTATDYGGPWKPSIHMHRWRSRLTLEIVSVRVERLQEISEADALAEGISWPVPPTLAAQGITEYRPPIDTSGVTNLRDAAYRYRDLWGSINGPGSWDANPWVWVVEFKRVNA